MAVPACVRKAITKYNKKAYHLVSVYAPKGTKEKVKGLAKESNMSFAKYIREAIEEKIVFDGLLSREEFFPKRFSDLTMCAILGSRKVLLFVV